MMCEECGVTADDASGWRAYWAYEDNEEPEPVVYCPSCAECEFSDDDP